MVFISPFNTKYCTYWPGNMRRMNIHPPRHFDHYTRGVELPSDCESFWHFSIILFRSIMDEKLKNKLPFISFDILTFRLPCMSA